MLSQDLQIKANKLDIRNKELQNKEQHVNNVIQQKEKQFTEEKEQLRLSIINEQHNILENEKLIINKQKEDECNKKLADQQKTFDEYVKAKEQEIGRHSRNAGESFEKYIELGLLEHFADKFNIDGDSSNFCMDIRMINDYHNIGIEAKSKNKIISKDITKFTRDKVTNHFTSSVFISEFATIPNKTTKQNSWFINNDELWIQSDDIQFICSAISSFITFLDRNNQDSNINIINQQNDFILSLYDKHHETISSLIRQDKQFYHYLKNNNPDKLKNHHYIVPINKLTAKNQRNPY